MTKGYRANVALVNDGAQIAATVTRFLNDGSPQTREAVLAAVDYAQTQASADNPVRIVLITSGTADSATSIADVVKQVSESNVELTVVHVGDSEQDQEVASAAKSTSTAANAGEVTSAIKRAAGAR